MNPDWTGSIQGLALLATGKPEYLPKLRDFARGPEAAVGPAKTQGGHHPAGAEEHPAVRWEEVGQRSV